MIDTTQMVAPMEKRELNSPPTSERALPRYSMKSDALSWLQPFYQDGAALSQLTGLIRFRIIVDANVILKDLRWLVKNRRDGEARPHLLELLEAQAIAVCAPTFLAQEVSDRISTIAAKQGLDEAAMRAHWGRYEPLIEFVDVGGPPVDDGSWADNKDVPYLELQRRIALPIMTEDKHIAQMGGIAVSKSITLTMRTYARASATQLSLEVAGTVSVSISLKAVASAMQGIRKIVGPTISRLPRSAWVILIGLGCLAILHPETRKSLTVTLLDALDKSASTVAAIAPILNSLQSDHRNAKSVGNAALKELQGALVMPQREDSRR